MISRGGFGRPFPVSERVRPGFPEHAVRLTFLSLTAMLFPSTKTRSAYADLPQTDNGVIDINIQPLMETNVYAVKGRVLVVGACLPQVFPEAFNELSAGADQVYSLCLETTHINMAVTKLSAVFGTGQLEKLTFASVDRSPHCTQMHYIMHEIERTLKQHVPVESRVVVDGRIIAVPDSAIDLSKSLGKLAGMV